MRISYFIGCTVLSTPKRQALYSQLAPYKLGDVPTKVRKTPRDLAQTRIYTTTPGFLRLPKSDGFQVANFGGLIPTDVWNRISRAFAAPRRCPALLLRGRMPWTILRV